MIKANFAPLPIVGRAPEKVIDVLLLQLGTPDAPTAKALRPYLKQFLSDPRVIEVPAWLRWVLVHLIILPFRAPKSARKYERIWDRETGSPLLSITRAQAEKLQGELGAGFRVHFAMRYGNPSTESVVRELMKLGCRRLVVVPMYPQYSATTTASGIDGLFDAFKSERVIPSIRLIADYHDDPVYIDALAMGIEQALADADSQGLKPTQRLLSFHGIPLSYIRKGDPYRERCCQTAKLLARRLGWSDDDWLLTFQSRLGPTKWLEPYTDVTLKKLGKEGVSTVMVAQPGFTADCLETIDEIGREGVEEFTHEGGKHLIRVPCVNDSPKFIEALAHLVRREVDGWRC